MIEKPPVADNGSLLKTYIRASGRADDILMSLAEQSKEKYEYWSEVKYKQLPPGTSKEDFWMLVKALRLQNSIPVWPRYGMTLCITNRMQRICHELDMNFVGSWGSNSFIPEENKNQYLISSLMEEAISSSQMEGASTTRKVAKDMLRQKISPKDKSQQMIFNNYQTIRFIVENKNEPLTEEMLLRIHGLMTEGTLDKPEDAGRFRQNDDVVVENGITHEIVHTPQTFRDIPDFIGQLCAFFNEKNAKVFIHPVIRAIIVHFMLAYVHPFVDGNGRTARALFYWYMLKQGYWLTEYLSISRIIARSKKSYEKSCLYAEADGNDIGYFVSYNLRVLEMAFKDLQSYIQHKELAKRQSYKYLRIGHINGRQAEIVGMFNNEPDLVLTVKDVQSKFDITPTTAKSDINGLLKIGLLSEIAFNKVKKGYVKSPEFDTLVAQAIG